MERQEPQSDFEPKPAYFDPDMADMSEQQFAASLEEITKPRFVVDTRGDSGIETLRPPAPELNVEEQASRPSEADAPIPDGQENRLSKKGHDWRDQVSAKVNHYKSRKAPKVRYPSLQLQFDPPPARGRTSGNFEPIDSQAGAEITAAPQTPVSLEATARVIEFPRIAAQPLRTDELAEPILERPRIVEAPALVPPPPALGGILIDESKEPEPERCPGFDMPLQSAAISRRLLAGAIDLLLVTGALAVFGYIFVRFNGPVQPGKFALQLTAILLAILWPAYQYAFLVFTGSTPGLLLSRLSLAHFDGTCVARSVRRWRVLASLLSAISLGLGYAWCLLDEDELSWHDRITKTHLAPLRSDDCP